MSEYFLRLGVFLAGGFFQIVGGRFCRGSFRQNVLPPEGPGIAFAVIYKVRFSIWRS